MLTLFALPKPFRGHIEVIQRNAIKSWTLLRPQCEVILIGDEAGTAETAAEFGLRHEPRVARNEYGTPLVNDIFARGQCLAKNNLLCYVNSDIILTSEFMRSLQRVAARKRRFLMVAQRWDIDITEPLEFVADWEETLRAEVQKSGILAGPTAIDFFAFTRGLWRDIPPFAIGRMRWDNWLLHEARYRRGSLIEVKDGITAIHQNHGYAHVLGDKKKIRESPEALQNHHLAGGWGNIFSMDDATHILTGKKLKRALDPPHLRRHLKTLPWLYRARYLSPLKRLIRQNYRRVWSSS
jgi:hypothetical protein